MAVRDNYVADIGDYFKYGFLRYLSGHTAQDSLESLKLGVVWYLYPDSCKETDGLHLDYLGSKSRDRFRPCDPELYDKLTNLVTSNKRSVLEVQIQSVLPIDTRFFAEPLSFTGLPKGNFTAISQRILHRQDWLQRSLTITKNSTLVFVDPDNGLEVKSTRIYQDKAPKFCFYEELAAFWRRGQNLIIYQHCNRSGDVATQIKNRKAELQERFPDAALIDNVYFPAYTGRIFYVVGTEDCKTLLSQRLVVFKEKFKAHVKL